MREIKFRVFDKQSKEMIYLETPKTFDNGLWFQSDKHIDSSDIELMQYTGLKDCEGQEIYECDIVQDINNNNSLRFGKDNNLSPVEFHEGSFGISVIYDGTFCSFSPCDQSDQEGFKFKVIGNIYENKELME